MVGRAEVFRSTLIERQEAPRHRGSVHCAIDVLSKHELPQSILSPFATDTTILVAGHRRIRQQRTAAIDLDGADSELWYELQTLVLRTEQIGFQP